MNDTPHEVIPEDAGHEQQQALEEQEIIEAEVVSRETSMTPSNNMMAVGGMHFADEEQMAIAVKRKATAMRQLVVQSGAIQKIQGKDYVKVEGWMMLAQLCGAVPKVTKIEEIEPGVYLATSVLESVDGRILQTAEAMCGDETDNPWNGRPKNARRSMAQTRAIGKVCRLSLSPVMTIGGFMATPAEEMPQANQAKEAERDHKIIDAIVRNVEGISVMLRSLKLSSESDDPSLLEDAAIAADEMDVEDIKLIWARTRGKGGVFSSADKAAMKTTEFRLLRPSVQEAMAKEQQSSDEWDKEYDAAEAAKE